MNFDSNKVYIFVNPGYALLKKNTTMKVKETAVKTSQVNRKSMRQFLEAAVTRSGCFVGDLESHVPCMWYCSVEII